MNQRFRVTIDGDTREDVTFFEIVQNIIECGDVGQKGPDHAAHQIVQISDMEVGDSVDAHIFVWDVTIERTK